MRQSPKLLLASTAIHAVSLFLRLAFWFCAWLVLRKFLAKITSRLTARMWLIVDMLMLASFVAIFTIICFMPEDTAIMYPICGASIFSSFGCMYLASYICDAMQTAYRAQELEMQRNYYKERIRDEERVRSVYHDMKNHLLVLAAQEKKIDFCAAIAFEAGSFLEPLDISTIFGNALDNAIEASEKLPEEERLITVRANRVRDMLLIIVENNAAPSSGEPKGTTKKDAFAHGFGLLNIRNAVEKYDGQCSQKQENGMFLLKIMIPIPLREQH